MNIFQKLKTRAKTVLIALKNLGGQPEPLKIRRDSLVDPEWATRQRRKESRFIEQYAKFLRRPARGCPVLCSDRLVRTQEQCSPKHLTTLCRGARITWSQQP
jgi:hypothetical protein